MDGVSGQLRVDGSAQLIVVGCWISTTSHLCNPYVYWYVGPGFWNESWSPCCGLWQTQSGVVSIELLISMIFKYMVLQVIFIMISQFVFESFHEEISSRTKFLQMVFLYWSWWGCTTQVLHHDFYETLYTCKAMKNNRHVFFLYGWRRNFKGGSCPSHVGSGFRKIIMLSFHPLRVRVSFHP